MVEVSAKDVMNLRKITGCGLMECKKALAAAGGDVTIAQQKMKEAGVLKAAKKSAREALEGVIHVGLNEAGTHAVMLEVNCETDFVGKDSNFKGFVQQIADHALVKSIVKLEDLLASEVSTGVTVEAMRQELVLKVGENIQLRRLIGVQAPAGGSVGNYLHAGRIGALVVLDVKDCALGKDLAMHVAANRPKAIGEADFPKQELENERTSYAAQAEKSGKPAEIQAKMVAGRMRKYLAEHSLLEQQFVKDSEVKVATLLKPSKGSVKAFYCYALGEV